MENIISLDSSVLINHYRKKNKNSSFFYSLVQQYEQFIISVVAEYEILIGARQPVQIEYWKNVFQDFFIIKYSSQINAPLATLNEKHFGNIPGLSLITPESI